MHNIYVQNLAFFKFKQLPMKRDAEENASLTTAIKIVRCLSRNFAHQIHRENPERWPVATWHLGRACSAQEGGQHPVASFHPEFI